MTRYFLTRLTIEGFRGINNKGAPLVLTFRRDAVNSIFAPNGVGKSSIFEALSYAIRGSIPKLEALPAADDPAAYYVNRFHSGQKATIQLTLEPDDGGAPVQVLVERDPSRIRSVTSPSGYPDPEGLLRSLDSSATLLDHQTFDRFVADTPLSRGRAFSALVGLGRLSEYRQVLEMLSNARSQKNDFALETLQTKAQNEQRNADGALAQVRAESRAFVGTEIQEPVDLDQIGVAALNALRGIALAQPFAGDTAFDGVDFVAVRQAIKDAEGSSKRDRLAEILKELSALAALAGESADADEKTSIERLIAERDAVIGVTRGPLFLQLYETAEQIIASGWTEPRECPLCDSSGLQRPIANHVAEHIEAYAAVKTARSAVKNHWNAARWVQRARRLDTRLNGEAPKLRAIDRQFSEYEPSADDLSLAVTTAADLELARQARISTLDAERQQLEAELPPSLVALTEQIQHAEQLQTSLRSYRKASGSATAIHETLQLRSRWCTFIDLACEAFASAEVALSTAKTLEIEKEYRDLYERVTMNPEVVPLLRKSPGSAELHLRLERFYGLNNLSASTLLPESYRNALAICIFLTAVQRTARASGFMILDDITSSFDAGHQFSLMEVLRTAIARPANPTGPQIIILSHDGLLEKYFDTLSGEAGWHHQKLQGLPPQGAVFSQAQNTQRLRTAAETFLKAGQHQEAAPLLRQHLEYSLLQVIRKVAIPVPLDFSIRDDRKMVENCLSAIRDAVSIHQKAGVLVLTQPQLDDIEKLHVPKLIANWVNHYATGTTASLSPYVLLGVLKTVDDFVDCFRYDCSCGGGTQRRFYKSLSQRTCNC